MAKYTYDIDIEANSEQEAEEKIQAFINLNESLPHRDLVECCEFVETHPETVKLIKRRLPDLEGKDTLGIVAMSGKLISEVKAAMAIDEENSYED